MTKNAKYQKERAKEMAEIIMICAYKASMFRYFITRTEVQHKRLQLIKEKI